MLLNIILPTHEDGNSQKNIWILTVMSFQHLTGF